MEKKLSLPELVKRYLAQPFTNFNYPDTSSDTPEEKKEEEETKKPIVYIPPSGDGGGGDGGIGSLNPYGGTPIQGGFDGGYGADPISGDLPGGGVIVDEFGIDGDVYAGTGINNIGPSGDLPGGGNLYDEFNPPGSGPISGGGGFGFSGAGPGVNPTTGDIVGGGNIVDEFGTDGNTNDGGGGGGFSGAGPGVDATTGDLVGGGNIVDEFGSGGGGGGGGGCFIKGTLITMADGSTKPVEQVDLEDEVAVGGKVFAVGRFLNTELYDYKGIKVSGSHMVNEDGVWMRVRDTKHGKSLGDDKNTVYVFGSENRRILINKILFTDYFEVNEQDILIEDSEDFFNNSKSYGKIIDKQNVDILNAS